MNNLSPQAFDLKSLLPPFHSHTLPSAGFYSDIPSSVNVRGLTVRELKHLTASGRFDKKVFDQTIAYCIKEPLDLSKLLLQDYNFIVYLVRLYSSGSKSSGRKRCKNISCGAEYSFDYNQLNNLPTDPYYASCKLTDLYRSQLPCPYYTHVAAELSLCQ